uniref:Uncharacterized protein n=1 Tax=Hanusia phi TaxID=3032 RepID=A0A7S0E4Y4_9CRYP
MLVTGNLLPIQLYRFSFELRNLLAKPETTVMIVGNDAQCPTRSRPFSTFCFFRFFTESSDSSMASEAKFASGSSFFSSISQSLSYTITSLADAVSLYGCQVSNPLTGELLLPAGRWFLSFDNPTYYSERVELRSVLNVSDAGLVRQSIEEGTACGGYEARSSLQTCRWWPRPSFVLDLFLFKQLPQVIRFALRWGDLPANLDLYVVYKPLLGQTLSYSSNNVSCSSGLVISGGGVYWGCREMYAAGQAGLPSSKSSQVLLERIDADGNGPEVVKLTNALDGDYQVYVNVHQPDFDSQETFAGAEELSIYFPDGQVHRMYTSANALIASWWYVGYVRKRGGSTTWNEVSFDQIMEDPIPYVAGFRLRLLINVRDAATGQRVEGVTYDITGCKGACTTAAPAARVLVAKGIVAGASISFANLLFGVQGSSYQEYIVSLNKENYLSKALTVKYEGDVFSQQISTFVTPADNNIWIILAWNQLVFANLDLWVFPCSDAGAFEPFNAACQTPLSVRQTCKYATLKGTAGQVRYFSAATDVESVILDGIARGHLDVWVQAPVTVNLRGQDVNLEIEDHMHPSSSSILLRPDTATDGSWWHIGYFDALLNFVVINKMASSPAFSGCRIPLETVSASILFAPSARRSLNQPLILNLSSGITLQIAQGAWPANGPSQVELTQLLLPPILPDPATMQLESNPVVYLEPSGIILNSPGVQLSMPVLSPPGAGQTCRVHKLDNGEWRWSSAVNSTFSAQEERTTVTLLSFSAYANLIVMEGSAVLAPQTSPPPALTGNPINVKGNSFPVWLIIVVAVGGTAVMLLSYVFTFRLLAKRFPWQRGDEFLDMYVPVIVSQDLEKQREMMNMEKEIQMRHVSSTYKKELHADLVHSAVAEIDRNASETRNRRIADNEMEEPVRHDINEASQIFSDLAESGIFVPSNVSAHQALMVSFARGSKAHTSNKMEASTSLVNRYMHERPVPRDFEATLGGANGRQEKQEQTEEEKLVTEEEKEKEGKDSGGWSRDVGGRMEEGMIFSWDSLNFWDRGR